MSKAIKILSVASYLPKTKVTNDDLSKIMDTSDEWIVSHTGIKNRYYAMNDENTSDLAAAVGVKLLQKANLDASDIDLLIVSTISPDALTPSTAAIVEKKLGLKNAFAYDLSAACAGFIYALSTAEKFVNSDQYQRAMVISAEVNSKMMDFTDRTSTVFFGDGAAGVIIEKSDDKKSQYLAEKLETSGDEEVIHSGRMAPIQAIEASNYPQMDAFFQQGRQVAEFVDTKVANHMKEFLAANNLTFDDIEYVIPHQANLRVIEKLAAKLGVPMDKVAQTVVDSGNISSVGIPLALNKRLEEGNLKGKVLLTGFGAGLAIGSILLEF